MEIWTCDEPHFLFLSMQHFPLAPEQGVQIEQTDGVASAEENSGETTVRSLQTKRSGDCVEQSSHLPPSKV